MKARFVFLLATGIGSATMADVSLSRAQDLMRVGYTSWPFCSVTSGCFSDSRSSLSADMKVADDYCNTRCDQQFNYCRYRDRPFDYCLDRLKTCRARC